MFVISYFDTHNSEVNNIVKTFCKWHGTYHEEIQFFIGNS